MSTAYVVGGSDALETTEPFEGNSLTSDHERWRRTKAVLDVAPDLGLGSPTIGWLKSALRSCSRISRPRLSRTHQCPAVDVCRRQRHRRFDARRSRISRCSTKVASCILMPGARHEILQETDSVRTRFWAAFDAYLGVDAKVA